MPRLPLEPALQAVQDRVGDAELPDAFAPATVGKIDYPDAREWSVISPPLGSKTAKRGFVPNIPKAPTLPASLAKYVKKDDSPYRRLLRSDPLPGESRARAKGRVAKVRSFLASKASHQRTVNLRARQAGRIGTGAEWRIAVTGFVANVEAGALAEQGTGTQRSGWRLLTPGGRVSTEEIKASYFEVCRNAVQESTSKIYKGTSGGAIFFPKNARIEYRQVGAKKVKSRPLFIVKDGPEDGEDLG